MTTILLGLTLTAFLAVGQDSPRKPNPLAPSLPLLTDEEEDKLDEIIDRFIAADICKLTGAEARQALRDFNKLGPEAIPALIRGLNRAAKIEGSCPAVYIARKLSRMLNVTQDRELLEFARENIGAGVGATRHAAVLQDLRVACMFRKAALSRLGISQITQATTAGASSQNRPLRSLSTRELALLSGSERGPRLKAVLRELEGRRGPDVLAALGAAAASYERDVQQLARDLLLSHLSRQDTAAIKENLKDDRAEVRAAAARTAARKSLHLEAGLIDLLDDRDAGVRQAGHAALVQLSGGLDHGPPPSASKEERAQAIKKWRAWLEKRAKP